MKQLFNKFKMNLSRWLAEQIAFISRNRIDRLDVDLDSLVPVEQDAFHIAILHKDMYVAFERRYKVISKKELKEVVENEMEFHSPFEKSKVIYRVADNEDGSWVVHYYFIDVVKYPDIERYGFIFIWEEVLRFLVDIKSGQPVKLNSPIGTQLIFTEGERLHVDDVHPNSLKQRILMTELETKPIQTDLNCREMGEKFVEYFASFSWLSLRGSFNPKRYLSKYKAISLSPRQLGILSIVLVAGIVAESAYLIGTDFYLDNRMKDSADIRNEYAQKKGEFLKKLDRYTAFAGIIENKSNASTIPGLLQKFEGDIRIDRMDYIQGEVRIGGISSDIESVMKYLSGHPQVKGLDFMSPITPDKSGKDRFLIRFDLLNV